MEFKVGDKVYDIMHKSAGIITNTNIGETKYPLVVKLEYGKSSTYTIDGRVNSYYKTPQLLHYRDDYNYDVINFNNLPKRQEPERWRAKKEEVYHFLRFSLEGWFCTSTTKESNWYYDNINYNSGNYFRTEAEAKIIAQKLNTYFNQLIQE